MSKFKVGDKVHYVGSIYRYVVGHGIIMRVLEAVEYPYSVSFNGQSSCPCSEDELELVEESDG